jgi:hypothetical protein
MVDLTHIRDGPGPVLESQRAFLELGRLDLAALPLGGVAVHLDERQYHCGFGPCIHAALSGEVVYILETASDQAATEPARAFADYGAVALVNAALIASKTTLATHLEWAMAPAPSSSRPRASLWPPPAATPTGPSPNWSADPAHEPLTEPDRRRPARRSPGRDGGSEPHPGSHRRTS